MISLYSGTPGSGKSLYAAYEVIKLLKLKKGVIANFPIDLGYFGRHSIGVFEYVPNNKLTVDYLLNFAELHHKKGRENQTTIFIDECSTLFNSREWGRDDRMKWIVFFQQHRKLGFNVVLISQNDRLIDRQIRSFIETEFKFRSIKNFKTFGFLLNLFAGGVFMKVEYWYPVRSKCSSQIFRFNRKKAKIYDTYAIFG